MGVWGLRPQRSPEAEPLAFLPSEDGAAFIRDHIIRVADRAFDDFAAASSDLALNRSLLGLR